MLYKRLNNGVSMPMLGFGTYQISDPKECEKCVIEAIGAGYRLIDTAALYGNETAVGAGIRHCGVDRKEIFLTTKLWFRDYETADAEAAVSASLKRLGVEYVDLMLLHWPFGNTYAAWRVLEKFYRAGYFRAVGVSNFGMARMIDLMAFNEVPPAVNQIETHLFCRRKGERRWMEKYGVAHQAYMPLGRQRAGEMFSLAPVQAAAAAHGKTPAQVLLRFLVQNGIAIIPKSARAERIRENAAVFDFALTEKEMQALAALDTDRPMIGDAENPENAERFLAR